MPDQIGAQHDFHDQSYAKDWAQRFVPTEPRQAMFDTIIQNLHDYPLPHPHIVELGLGPGYLALEILQRIPTVTYEGIDFSAAMFQIATHRLQAYRPRLTFTEVDLTKHGWAARISRPAGAIVSTWALHDLGSETHIRSVYDTAKQILPTDGLFLNGDFIKPATTRFDYEPGRLPIARHLELLEAAGFRDVQCLAYLEAEVENPTSANNYACFKGVV
jgi:SAM-dependent methyltransferase